MRLDYDSNNCCYMCGEHIADPHALECPRGDLAETWEKVGRGGEYRRADGVTIRKADRMGMRNWWWVCLPSGEIAQWTNEAGRSHVVAGAGAPNLSWAKFLAESITPGTPTYKPSRKAARA